MRLTTVLLNKKRSLALSVYFKQPELGMKDYEILSRASAFLIGIDPPDITEKDMVSPYQKHLSQSVLERELKEFRRIHNYTPAGGPRRRVMDLNWFEFVPREYRPNVHVVTSSHVAAPYLWKDYYPQDWLSVVRPEHCKFTLEVYDESEDVLQDESYDPNRSRKISDTPRPPLARVALNTAPQPSDYRPFHHPEGRDVALLHFQDEAAALDVLKRCGVEILFLRDVNKWYEKGEQVWFDGYVVAEPATDSEGNPIMHEVRSVQTREESQNEDKRVFYPYKETGFLAFRTGDRYFAKTEKPLPEGLCGAPVLDKDGAVCGIVEGIIPVKHENKDYAGAAGFLPHTSLKQFIDYIERRLLEHMMPPDLFEMAVQAKKTNTIGGGGLVKKTASGEIVDITWDEAYEGLVDNLRKRHTDKEVEEILARVQQESEEVSEIMDREGGDLDEIIRRVRLKSIEAQLLVKNDMQLRLEKGGNKDESTAQTNVKT